MTASRGLWSRKRATGRYFGLCPGNPDPQVVASPVLGRRPRPSSLTEEGLCGVLGEPPAQVCFRAARSEFRGGKKAK
ncbi:hypothetical protein MPNT_10174 [Candidatus Methylacidithermus pantelleriae]|uniref:Uncharacterized protein n=1 Tax=Candidatus Methylacidithermus pantelleriae TaxID=2744239 RepID=A0A8J2BFQ8_9BACT|nr:hypothetical protein MPNT_10174 [Candidatus Methylacidithermus pantelleriae]